MSTIFQRAFCVKDNWHSLWHRPDERLAALDGLRALAILYVILFHAFLGTQYLFSSPLNIAGFTQYLADIPAWLRWVWHGDRGVDIFFVLSGFLIGGMLFREHQQTGKIKIGRFYWRRFLRLMPLYLLLIILYFHFGPERGRDYVWANLLYVNNFLPAENVFIDWSWSLAVEEQFYLLFPLFLTTIFFKTHRQWLTLIALLILSILIRVAVLLSDSELVTTPHAMNSLGLLPEFNVNYGEKMYSKFYTRFGPLVLGIMGAYLHIWHSNALRQFFLERARLANLLLVLMVTILMLLTAIPMQDPGFVLDYSFAFPLTVLDRHLFSLAILYILLHSLFPSGLAKGIHWVLSRRVLYPVAQLSYGLYLFHPAAVIPAGIVAALFISNPANFLVEGIFLTALLTFFFTSLFCIGTWLFIEKPFINLRNTINEVEHRKDPDVKIV